jgi:hypothetical protein
LVVDVYKAAVHHHNLVEEVDNNLVEVDTDLLDYMVDNLVVDLVADNKAEHLQDKIAVVVEEVDHNLVVHKHLQLVHNHLVADNN